ncbi:recombinase family protein [Escherichia coli]
MANIGYIRVWTFQQNTDRQLAGVTLDKVFEDKASGKNTQRPQFEAMMNYVREGDVLHVHSIDRLCRNTADLLATVEQLTERGVSVHFHKEDFKTKLPAGNMMLTVLAAVAQMEREMMLERQREGIAAAKAAGRIAKRGNGKAIDRAGIVAALANGGSIRSVAKDFSVSTQTVQRIKKEQEA